MKVFQGIILNHPKATCKTSTEFDAEKIPRVTAPYWEDGVAWVKYCQGTYKGSHSGIESGCSQTSATEQSWSSPSSQIRGFQCLSKLGDIFCDVARKLSTFVLYDWLVVEPSL